MALAMFSEENAAMKETASLALEKAGGVSCYAVIVAWALRLIASGIEAVKHTADTKDLEVMREAFKGLEASTGALITVVGRIKARRQ